jgi:hypothetical protein
MVHHLSSTPQPSPTPSVYGSAEEAIEKTIEGIQTLLNPVNMTPEEEKERAVIKISEATQKHFELQIRTLHDAPRDAEKLKQIIESKEKKMQEDTSMHIDDVQNLVTEIEMLKFVLFLVNRNSSS